MARRDEEAIADWLLQLVMLIGARLEADDLQTRIDALVGQLSGDFPADAFCNSSLRLAARKLKFFPSYAELCEVLDEFWREHKPDAVNDQDQVAALVRNWQRHASGDWGKTQATPNSLRYELGYYRDHHGEVFIRLVETDERAKRIARANGWMSGAKIVPLRPAAAPMPQEVKRGPANDDLDFDIDA